MNEAEFTQLQNYYRETQAACREYFAANTQLTPFEQNRSGVMQSISRLLDKDMAVLDKCDPKEPCSLSEIIGRSRSHTVVLKGDDIQKVGGDMNSRIPLKTPSGKKGFFTPTTIYNIDKKWASRIETHMEKHKEALSRYPQIDKNIIEKLKTDPDLIHKFCLNCPSLPYEDFIETAKNPAFVRKRLYGTAMVLGVAPTIAEAGKILEADKKGIQKAVINFINSMAPLVNQYAVMQTAGIKKNSNTSERNCAMSDMANLFGCDNLLANSVPMKIKIDGKEVDGVFMETAEGSDINNLRDDDPIFNTSFASFSNSNAMDQLTDLQVLDYICGNVDRHNANIIYQFGKDKNGSVVLNGIKGIDNDCSFGVVNPKEGKSAMRMVNPENMQYITQRMMDKLESITPSALRMKLANYHFSEDELNAVCSRAEKVKQAVKEEKIKVIDKDFWKENPIIHTKTKEGNYLFRIKQTALSCMDGYKRRSNDPEYKEINYMKDRRESNKVLLSKADSIAQLREKMDNAKSLLFNSSEYNLMKKHFEQVEKLSKIIKTEYAGHPERIPEAIASKLEKAYTDLADKTLRYIELKKLVPSSVRGQKRMAFAQELMEFADDTLQEMTKNPEMEAESAKAEPAEIEAPDDGMEL